MPKVKKNPNYCGRVLYRIELYIIVADIQQVELQLYFLAKNLLQNPGFENI